MEDFVDHYIVLGLPSGEEALKFKDEEIKKAYKAKALVLHPDKRRDDPNAHEKFHRLKTFYEVLSDEKARKLFDDLLRIQHEKMQKKSQVDSKRRKMMSDLGERERSAFAPKQSSKPVDEEERISRKLKEEVERIRREHAKKKRDGVESPESGVDEKRKGNKSGSTETREDKERMLKVSWDVFGKEYTAESLREVFSEFGDVEDVIRSNKKKCSAFIVMATKMELLQRQKRCAAISLIHFLVVPHQKASQTDFLTAKKSAEGEPQSNIVAFCIYSLLVNISSWYTTKSGVYPSPYNALLGCKWQGIPVLVFT